MEKLFWNTGKVYYSSEDSDFEESQTDILNSDKVVSTEVSDLHQYGNV